MRVQFQCTYEDFREANLGHAAAQTPGGKPARPLARLAVWLVFGAVVMIWMFLIRASKEPSAAAPPVVLPSGSALTLRFLNASVFSLLYCVSYAVLLTRLAVKTPRPAWLMPRKGQRWERIVVVAIIAVVGVLVVRVLDRGDPDVAGGPSLYEVLLSTTPCLFLIITLGVFSSNFRRLDLKRRWKAQTFLHRPYTLETGEAGIVLEEAMSMNRYNWQFFPGFRETTNTLLLYVSPYGFWIIPKRAFGTTEELEAFKALLLTHVMEGTLLPSTTTGFPVKLLPPPGLPPTTLPPTAHLASDVRNQPGA